MGTGSVVALEFVIDLCWRSESLLKEVCAYQRGRAIHLIKLKHRLRDVEETSFVVEFLLVEFLAEDGVHLLNCESVSVSRMNERCRLVFHVCTHVVPLSRDFILVQVNLVRNLLFHSCKY